MNGYMPITTQVPYMSGSSQQSYYQGPNMNPYPYSTNSMDDYDNKIAKIERQINRLDARIAKLENASKIINDDMSSMYMI